MYIPRRRIGGLEEEGGREGLVPLAGFFLGNIEMIPTGIDCGGKGA